MISWIRALAAVGLLGVSSTPAMAQEVYLRVVDVGNGLCVVGRVPGGGFLYDGGHHGSVCRNAVREVLPGSRLDLLVLSHSDADHIGEADGILAERTVGTIIHPGDDRAGQTLGRVRAAIVDEVRGGAREINLARDNVEPGTTLFRVGDAALTFVAGWSDGRQTRRGGEPALPAPERRNALSIVLRLDYGGRSVLLTGDTIGRLGGEPNAVCRYAERIMVERNQRVRIDSDVLIGQHHGGDNATANCFIRAVSPTYVVFSAGHGGHEHPRQSVADRLVAHAIDPDNIFRTDRGDNEGGPEWVYGSIAGCRDRPGDDDVEIRLPRDVSRPLSVSYRVQSSGC